MLAFFLCGVARVVIPTAFLVLAFADTDLAARLMMPFAVFVAAVMWYDEWQRRRYRGRRGR